MYDGGKNKRKVKTQMCIVRDERRDMISNMEKLK